MREISSSAISKTLRYAVVRKIVTAFGFRLRSRTLRFAAMGVFLVVILASSLILEAKHLTAAVIVIGVGYGLVFLTAYFWFLEERRNRDIVSGVDRLKSDDGLNAEFRQEALFASTWLFVLTPLLLHAINSSTLHLVLTRWFQGQFAGVEISSEPIQWLVYTLIACANTFPVVEYMFPDASANLAGIVSTADTPYLFSPLIEALFAIFLISLVVQQAGQARQRIQEAIDALGTTFVIAAALGPRVIVPLCGRLEVISEVRFRNAALALAQIATRYSQTREQIRELCGEILIERFDQVKPKTKDGGERRTLNVVTIALASMDHGAGVNKVCDRVLNKIGESYANRAILIDALAEARSFQKLKELHERLIAIGQTKLAGRVNQHLDPDLESDVDVTPSMSVAA